MRKFFKSVLFILIFFISANNIYLFSEQNKKEINIYGSIGIPIYGVESFIIKFGSEFQFTENLFGQLQFDIHLVKQVADETKYSGYCINYYQKYIVFKKKRFNLFLKGGINYFLAVRSKYPQFNWRDDDLSFNYYGIGGGFGIDFKAEEKINIIFGSTIKGVIDFKGFGDYWLEVYCGLLFKI